MIIVLMIITIAVFVYRKKQEEKIYTNRIRENLSFEIKNRFDVSDFSEEDIQEKINQVIKSR